MNNFGINDNPEYVVEQVVAAMQAKKAKKIVSLDLTEIPNTVAKYFVICGASSKIQVGAIYDNIIEWVKKKCGINPFNKEGYQNAEWILIDYIDVVVHVFIEDIREFYQLENLWGDAKFTKYDNDKK